jgi:hypothetical protein
MGAFPVCDRGGCPAPALHHVEILGQDFHFCHHHWCELPDEQRQVVRPRPAVPDPPPVEQEVVFVSSPGRGDPSHRGVR